MKILICCANGISTSMLREKVNVSKFTHEVNSTSIGDIDSILQKENYDVLFVAPQLSHRQAFFKRVSSSYHIPFEIIDYVAYGRMDVEAIMKAADKYQ